MSHMNQVLADRISVGATLTRGDYNRGWNTVLLLASDVAAFDPASDAASTSGVPASVTAASTAAAAGARFPPIPFVVDLMHFPGRLMAADSSEASAYMKI